jgi:hypothetical protein
MIQYIEITLTMSVKSCANGWLWFKSMSLLSSISLNNCCGGEWGQEGWQDKLANVIMCMNHASLHLFIKLLMSNLCKIIIWLYHTSYKIVYNVVLKILNLNLELWNLLDFQNIFKYTPYFGELLISVHHPGKADTRALGHHSCSRTTKEGFVRLKNVFGNDFL